MFYYGTINNTIPIQCSFEEDTTLRKHTKGRLILSLKDRSSKEYIKSVSFIGLKGYDRKKFRRLSNNKTKKTKLGLSNASWNLLRW